MKPQHLILEVPEAAILFEYGTDIPELKLYQLLSHPREKLWLDGRQMLQHAYEYEAQYMEAFTAGNIGPQEIGFPHHAIQLLAETGDENALRAIATFLVQGWESWSFWFGNLRPFWATDVLYMLGKNQLSVLSEAYMDPHGHLFARACAAMAVAKTARVSPTRAQEVESMFMLSLDEIETWNEALFGTDREAELPLLRAIVPVLAEESRKLGMTSVLERIREIAQTEAGVGMTEAEVNAKIKSVEIGLPQIAETIPDIRERYAGISAEFEKVIKENPAPLAPNTPKYGRIKEGTVRKLHKVGRNEPCPCGSGKKYKKCCGA